ncbi:MAG: B12-binding domain-containing radical SAM protein [Candidatus Omnitrophica bacterium]|nr:B12-binding domain-containing radical SAM protein [Candidatus Omnitrophota bacterium]
MKIILIIPNSGKIPPLIPLGTLYIASALKKAGDHQIKIIDARVGRLNYKEISGSIKSFSPELVGITGLCIEAPEVHKLVRLVKQIDAQYKVVVGGAYATFCRESIIEDPNIDFVVIGEGEKAICNLVDALENGKNISGIDGIGFKNGSKTTINLPVALTEDIDSIPLPAWGLIDMEKYFHGPHKHSQNPASVFNRIAPLFTSRGCPFGCIFCHNIFGKKVRARSVRNVVEEIEVLIKEYAVEEIEIIDDIFNFDLARAKQICDEIIKRGIKIHLSFPNALRADMMDEELIVKLKKAGTYLIYYAIDSASPEVQKQINKNLDLEKSKEVINMTIRHGIATGGYFMLGFPGETREQMRQTIRFALKSKLHFASFFYVASFPHTALSKRLGRDTIDQESFNHSDVLKLTRNFSSVPDSEFRKLVSRAYGKFYFRPYQMWRIWKVLPNKIMVLRNLCMVLGRYIKDRFH